MGLPLLLIALNSTPIAPDFVFVMIGIPALLAIGVGLGIWALILTVGYMRRREWSRAVASAVLPLGYPLRGSTVPALSPSVQRWRRCRAFRSGTFLLSQENSRNSSQWRASPLSFQPWRDDLVVARLCVRRERRSCARGASTVCWLEGARRQDGTQLRLLRPPISRSFLVHAALVSRFIQLLAA